MALTFCRSSDVPRAPKYSRRGAGVSVSGRAAAIPPAAATRYRDQGAAGRREHAEPVQRDQGQEAVGGGGGAPARLKGTA